MTHQHSNYLSRLVNIKPVFLSPQFRWLLKNGNGIMTCSALKRKYRNILINGSPEVSLTNEKILIVHPHGDRETLLHRLKTRQGHFMPATMLDSQLDTLEIPTSDEHCLSVDIHQDMKCVVQHIIQHIDN